MRAAYVLLALLATQAALLFVAPAEAARSLSQDTSNTVSAIPAAAATGAVSAADPAATVASTGVSVDVEVDVEGASCAAVRNRVRNEVNAWFRRVFVFVSVESTRCTANQGTARVVVRVRIPGVPGGSGVIVNIINSWALTIVDVNAWAKSVREINNLVVWAGRKNWKITRVNVIVQV